MDVAIKGDADEFTQRFVDQPALAALRSIRKLCKLLFQLRLKSNRDNGNHHS